MARQFPLWVIVLLPWLGAIAGALVARVGPRLLGTKRAGMFAHYLALGASTLAMLFCAQVVQQLLVPDDPRAFGHTPFGESLGAVEIGALKLESTLIGDRLSASAGVLLLALMVLTRMFVPGPAGQRALGLTRAGVVVAEHEARRALERFALLGALEGAALLVIFAGDLGLAAIGWLMLGLGAAMLVAREPGDERRGDTATRALAWGLCGDLGLAGAGLALVVGGIGLAHNNLWAPLTGDQLYELVFSGFSRADLIASLLALAALVRLVGLAWTERSLGEMLLDAVLISIPAVYVLLRYQRVLSYAPTVLLILLLLGALLAPSAAAVALLRPRGLWRAGLDAQSVGRRALGLCWVGLVCMALGVGAWRSAALLLLAQTLSRLSLRLALVIAGDRGGQLPPVTASIAGIACFGAGGLAPGLMFAALAQTMVDVLTRASLIAPWISWPAAAIVLFVAFVFAVATARIWYEDLAQRPGADARVASATAGNEDEDEDGLDFAPLLVAAAASAVLGIMTIGAWFGWWSPPLAWLDKVLPLAGGHEGAPVGLQAWARPEIGIGAARTWTASCAALVAVATGYGWAWARERFRRGAGEELEGWSEALARTLALPGRVLAPLGLLAAGLCELAARGLGRGLFEEGPRVAAELGRDWSASLAPRLRAASPGGGRVAMLGLLAGVLLVLGWLYAKPEVASPVPTDNYGFGGLRPRLIRAGGDAKREAGQAQPAAAPTDAAPTGPDPAGPEPARAGPGEVQR